MVRVAAASTSGLTYLGAARHGIRQRGEHARSIGGRVHAEHEERVAVVPVVKVDRALAGGDRRFERATGGLVAHVRAVGQVVRAVLAHHQLVEERGLVAEPPGGVERRLIGAVQRLQLVADERERVVPRDRHVVISRRVVDHRLGQAPLVFEIEVGPGRELRDGVLGEEPTIHPLARHLPGDVLDAVLADVCLLYTSPSPRDS